MSGSSETPRSQALWARAGRVIPGGVNSHTRANGAPLSLVDAEGAHVTDADGRRYLDFHAAFGAILLGHRHPIVDDAVADSRNGVDLAGFGVTEAEVQLAELIADTIPSIDQTVLVNTGSEAVAYALRIARAHTGRRLIVKIQGGFHGWSDAVARNVISAPGREYGDDPISAGILPEVLEATLIAEWNDLDSIRRLFEQHPDQIAAVIVEPIPHNVGALLPEHSFLSGLRELTRDRGALLIFDEVITGFRHALGGYQSIVGIDPDLTTFGKAMGNGYATAGVGGPERVMRRADPGKGGDVSIMGTFNGNPISCAASLATIGYLQQHPDFYERTYALGERMRSGLRQIFADNEVRATVAGHGGTFTIYFGIDTARGYRDLVALDRGASAAYMRGMIERGHLLLPMAMKRNHISGAFTEADVDDALAAARDTAETLAASGDLPRAVLARSGPAA